MLILLIEPDIWSPYLIINSYIRFVAGCCYSPVENQNDLKLDFKVFSLLTLVVEAMYLMNPTYATLASLSVLKYLRWRLRWPSVELLRPI